jgi:hypothetical protein
MAEEVLSGEFFDVTISDYLNQYGGEKIRQSLTYGIKLPIDKYIEELRKIVSGPKDDKSNKRYKRLNFLEHCSHHNNHYLYNFFEVLIWYLNGCGDGGENNQYYDQYNNQKVIITVTGGNIYTIYAKLLRNIDEVIDDILKEDPDFQYVNDSVINKLTKTNRFIINVLKKFKYWRQSIKHIIIGIFKNLNELYKDSKTPYNICDLINILLLESSDIPYSDFDYCILPNAAGSKDYALEAISELDFIQQETDTSKIEPGFALFRIKSVMNCKYQNARPHINRNQQKKDCYNYFTRDEYKDLYAQLVDESLLDDSTNGNRGMPPSSDCYKYIEYLIEKKNNIKKATTFNIKSVINYFAQITSRDSNNEVLLEAIIYYINYTTRKLNNYIRMWEEGNVDASELKIGRQTFYGIKNVSYLEVVKSFATLNNIYERYNGFLLRLCAGIIESLLNDPDAITGDPKKSLTEDLFDYIKLNKNQEGYNCEMPPYKLTVVASSGANSMYYDLKNKIEKSLFAIGRKRYGPKGVIFPDGVHITLNTIFTNTDPEQYVLNLDKPSVDKLATLLEGLVIVDMAPRHDNKDYLLQTRRTGGRKKRKTKKIKNKNKKKQKNTKLINNK